jgi:hypothetical protein
VLPLPTASCLPELFNIEISDNTASPPFQFGNRYIIDDWIEPTALLKITWKPPVPTLSFVIYLQEKQKLSQKQCIVKENELEVEIPTVANIAVTVEMKCDHNLLAVNFEFPSQFAIFSLLMLQNHY